jgi:hypothetical protein
VLSYAFGLVALLLIASPLTAAQLRVHSSLTPPPLPFFEWKACPFEGCTYREWKAIEAVPLYTTWKKSRTQVRALAAGEKVVALTGVVITYQPGVVRMDRDFEELKRGDRVLTYASHGVGEITAWYKGAFHDFDMTLVAGAATYLETGRKEWWAQVRLRSGRTAWVWMDQAKFSGVDALG